jgi:hypothetical protein
MMAEDLVTNKVPDTNQSLPQRFPRAGTAAEAAGLSTTAQTRWIWAFLLAGVALRLVRYLLRFPLWEDEAMLSANFLDCGYLDLLRPLGYLQVCPPLFLWIQLTAVKLLGFTEYSLRLVPFAASLASLVLFRHVAGRLLRGTALLLAVGIFAVGYPMIRYAAEAKPYGCDLLLAMAMLALVVEWLRREDPACPAPRPPSRYLWALVAIVGPAVLCSYPAVFVAGAMSLVVGYELWSSRRRDNWLPEKGDSPRLPRPAFGRCPPEGCSARRGTVPFFLSGWLPWIVFNAALAGSFAVLLMLNRTAVGTATMNVLSESWSDRFVPINKPLKLPGWFFAVHTGGMMGFPIGGPGGGSTLTFLCCVAGVAALARRRQWLWLSLLLGPLGFNFVAGAMQRFPYGSHVRLSMYMGAAFCMLMAIGIVEALGWLATRRKAKGDSPIFGGRKSGQSPLLVILALLMLLAAGTLLRDLAHPYKSGTTLRARAFAHWFWNDLAQDGEVVCLKTDWKEEELSPGTYDYGWSALYLCNQRIYSPRHARGEPPRWDRISESWPLRCALYRSATEERKSPALDNWLAQMQARYRLVYHDRYPFPVLDKWERRPITVDHIEVFKFVPLTAP